MFDMNKSADRRRVLSALALILLLSCVPMLLVVCSELDDVLAPSVIVGAILYFVFRNKNR